MKKRSRLNVPLRGRILISLVSLVLGFILAYSYSMASADKEIEGNSSYSVEIEKYREKLIEQKEMNKDLTEEINQKQQEIRYE